MGFVVVRETLLIQRFKLVRGTNCFVAGLLDFRNDMVRVRESGVVVYEDEVEYWVGTDPFDPDNPLEDSSDWYNAGRAGSVNQA